MKSQASLRLFASALVFWLAACNGGTDDPAESAATGDTMAPTDETGDDEQPLSPAPPLRNAVGLPDDELAYQALILMGHGPLGATGETCSECHSLNQGLVESWASLTIAAENQCFASEPTTAAEARDLVDCLRQKPGMKASPFHTPRLGMYSGAAHLEYFDWLFEAAYGPESAEQASFAQRVTMPRPPRTPWTQGEFDVVAEWFDRGLPLLAELLPGPPPAGGCVPNIEPEVAEHVDRMATEGWQAVNESNDLLMFGCAGAATALDCLGDYPTNADWPHVAGSTIRVLRTNGYPSSYWTRSSADGRYVAHGGSATGQGSTIVDLARDFEIPAQAEYDPAFFPDNTAFVFQESPGGTAICDQGFLRQVSDVDFDEQECGTSTQIGLYQHVGAALGGGDYWAVAGAFVSDDGGQGPTGRLPAWFDANERLRLTPMVNTGTSFESKPVTDVSTPYEGDTVISRSSELAVSRLAGEDFEQQGFVLRKIEATPAGNGYLVEAPIVATYCLEGGKPDFSFDERWMVLHRYVTDADAVDLGFTGPSDPGFSDYQSSGAANLFLVDLKTGLERRITNVAPGEYAVFPHFRSDGWIYFMVRTMSMSETIAASDAALVLEN